jgi:cell wall-associated NlpC family hydrolase
VYASEGQVAEVTSLMANLYREPDVTTARPKLQAALGTRLEVAPGRASERWLSVRLPDGELAYLQRGDVRLGDARTPRSRGTETDLVATARRFLGVPYLWGGMTPHGVDCSGFVSRVYLVNGVTLLRDADLQFNDPKGEVVERDALRPGDLLFFGSTKKITHVGMYEGDGRFIHATTHGSPVVQESDLSDPHWTGLYQGARRPR